MIGIILSFTVIQCSVTMKLPLFLFSISVVFASEQEPKIIIIGSGPAGIAAASKLLQNGITDITILEAENRIGGRVNSTKFGEYIIDLGGQWVDGEKNNAAYELAWPLGLLSRSFGPGKPEKALLPIKFLGSSGVQLSVEDSTKLCNYVEALSDNFEDITELKTGSYGEAMIKKLNKYFEDHKEIKADLRQPLIHSMHLLTMGVEGATDWNDVSLNGSQGYIGSEGYPINNWKERTYSTILDILMKRFPNPEEELPIVNKTLLNKKVTKIKYDADGPVEVVGPVKVITADGDEYTADHIICTVSLGVLKAVHQELFDPPLPEKNTNSIKNLGFGQNAKILLYYDEPWWTSEELTHRPFFWTEADRKEIENDPERSWMLGISSANPVEWKPKLFLLWLSGPYCEKMEKIPDELFKNQTLAFIEKFFGSSFNITQAKDIIRTFWITNENFRGTYSYRSVASDTNHASAEDLGSPLMKNGKPTIQFAGEATEPNQYGTVHGAITSGWREADRLIDIYNKKT